MLNQQLTLRGGGRMRRWAFWASLAVVATACPLITFGRSTSLEISGWLGLTVAIAFFALMREPNAPLDPDQPQPPRQSL